MSENRCEYNCREYHTGGYRTIPCANAAAWVYVNGAYRRLECDEHARKTRQFIRHPDVIRLEPIPAAGPDEPR